jgi:hypothetical protein
MSSERSDGHWKRFNGFLDDSSWVRRVMHVHACLFRMGPPDEED